jgi:hypothetical protein
MTVLQRARRASLLAIAAVGLMGCGAGSDDAPSCTATGETHAAVLTALAFTRETTKGIRPGFDLDGRVSPEDDPVTCGQDDFVDAEGRPGIDNQLAGLVPDVEKLVGNAVDGLVQGAINDGQLVILMEMLGVDDLRNDGCVDLRVRIGEKAAYSLGTDGVLEAFQTYDADPTSDTSEAIGGRIEDGVLTAGPFELAVPIAIFDVSFLIHVHGARFRFTIDDEGKMHGHFGGGVVPGEIAEGLKDGAGLQDIIPVVRVVMESAADLARQPEGGCTQMSTALEFRAVPAFIRP